MKKVLAICLKTYPDEDDMIDYAGGRIKNPSKVKIYHKGRAYKVHPTEYDKKYYKIIEKR